MITPIGPTTPFVAVPASALPAIQPVASAARPETEGDQGARDRPRTQVYGRQGMVPAHERGARVDRRA